MSFEFPSQIERSDIEALPIQLEGTEVVLQRHGKYERSVDNPRVGSLTPEGLKEISDLGDAFFQSLFSKLKKEERSTVDILVIGSDTQYRDGGRRSIETANAIIGAVQRALSEHGLSESQLLNSSGKYLGGGAVRPMPELREPQMFQNSPEFVAYLKGKYGDMGKEFWIAFEDDVEKETRVAMGAEGPEEIANRLKHVVAVLGRYGRMYHKKYPGRRLVIWSATHYDTISPFVKQEIFEVGKEVPLAVDYGAGIAIEIDPAGTLKTKIAGKEYAIGIATDAQ